MEYVNKEVYSTVSREAYGYYYKLQTFRTHTHNIYLPETVSLKIVCLFTVTVKDIP